MPAPGKEPAAWTQWRRLHHALRGLRRLGVSRCELGRVLRGYLRRWAQ